MINNIFIYYANREYLSPDQSQNAIENGTENI